MAKINTCECAESIKKLIDTCSEKHKLLSIRLISNLDKENSGVASYRITVAPLNERGTMTAMPKSIGIFYIRPTWSDTITTMIVSGQSMAPLFINSDEDSMEVGMTYLERILGRECESLTETANNGGKDTKKSSGGPKKQNQDRSKNNQK